MQDCFHAEDVAVMMALLKIARITTGTFKGRFLHRCGWLSCISRRVNKRREIEMARLGNEGNKKDAVNIGQKGRREANKAKKQAKLQRRLAYFAKRRGLSYAEGE